MPTAPTAPSVPTAPCVPPGRRLLAGERLVAVPLLAAAMALAGCAVAASPEAAGGGAALRVRRGDFEQRLLLSGELAAERAERLTVPRGRVWQVQLRWLERHGAEVKEGQRVVAFDNSTLTADLEDKRLAAVQAESELQRVSAEAARQEAEKRFAREQREVELGKAKLAAAVPAELLPAREAQERQLALRRAEVALAKAEEELRAQLVAAAADLEVRRIALAKTEREIAAAEEGIASLELESPGEGLFLVGNHPWQGRQLQVGDMIWPGVRVAEIPDLASLYVVARLPDVDDGRVAPGMAAECVLDAWPRERRACRVREIAPLAEEESNQSLRRFVRVLVDLDGVDVARMRPGMSVRVEVLAQRTPGVLLAPRAGLRLLAAESRARLSAGERRVELGQCNAQECVVVEGLAEGDVLLPAAEGGA